MKGPVFYEKLFQRVAEMEIYPRETTGVYPFLHSIYNQSPSHVTQNCPFLLPTLPCHCFSTPPNLLKVSLSFFLTPIFYHQPISVVLPKFTNPHTWFSRSEPTIDLHTPNNSAYAPSIRTKPKQSSLPCVTSSIYERFHSYSLLPALWIHLHSFSKYTNIIV